MQATSIKQDDTKDAEGEANTEPVIQWVTFRLEEELFGVNVIQVQEILRVSDITPVPGSPSYVLGIINLRGNIVTVIDMRQQLNMPSKEVTDLTRIVITEAEGLIVGFMVDSVADVADLTPSQIETAPTASKDDSQNYISGVTTRDGELLILLNLELLLSAGNVDNFSSF